MHGQPPKKLTYISLFSGIEAASVAWEPLGFQPLAFAEVDRFPSAVLKRRYPNVPNLGDVTKINWSDYYQQADIVVGGSPCQAFSIAGKREGLMDERGQLMLEYVRCVREVQPLYCIWENVPGVLSQSDGDAFETLQRELEQCGYALAWRVMDAQFFGVAQRRRRVFLVGVSEDRIPVGRSAIGCAAAILFEPESLRGDHPSNRNKRQELTSSAESSIRGNCLPINTMVATRGGKPGKGTGFGIGDNGDAGYTLQANHSHAVAYTMQVRCGCEGGGKGALIQQDMSATLSTSNIQTVFQPMGSNFKESANAGSADTTANGHEYVVRRFTPVECERLQGFPDEWTRIPWRGKAEEECPNGPRYKALGNSMAVPVMRWLGHRLKSMQHILEK